MSEKKRFMIEKVVRKTPSGAPIFSAVDKINKALGESKKDQENQKRKTALRKKGG